MKKLLFFISLMTMAAFFCQTWAQAPTSCNPSLPYQYDFNNTTHNGCWTVVDNNNDGATFTMSAYSKYACYHYHSTNSADDWLISPAFQLTGTEKLLFDYRCNYSNYHERFQVFAISGTDTIPLTSVIETQGNSYQTVVVDLTTLNGQYQIGFHCISIPDQYYLYITNIKIFSPPFISFNNNDVDFGLYDIGASSPAQQIIMSSFGCSSPITITAPANFEVSLDTVNYGTSLTFPANITEMRKDTFYVRYAPTTGGPNNKQLVAASGMYENHIMLHGLTHACNATMSLPFSENFEDSLVYCWTMLDQDGDGNTWVQDIISYAHSGSKAIYSESVYDSYNEQYIVQDNWLISQPVYISDTACLSYYVDALSWSFFNYSVLVSTTGNNPSDFTLLFADSTSSDNLHHRKISLANYVGQTIYLAFRNNSIQDCFIDDITIATLEDHPIVITTPNYIDYGNLSIGYGEVRSFQVETFGPVGNLSVSGTSICDFSLDGINFSNTVSLPSTGGTVYARYTPTTSGYSTQTVTVAAENAENQTVKLHGRGLQCYNTIPYTHNFNNSRNDCWSYINANQDYRIFYISGGSAYISINSGNDMDDWLISPMFELNGNQFGFFEYWKLRHSQETTFQVYAISALDTVPISQVVTVDDKDHHLFYFDLSSLQGFYHLGIRVMSDTTTNQEYFSITNFNIQNITPQLVVSPDTLDLGMAFLESSSQERLVELVKVGIHTPVSVSVQAPFEVSLDGVNYSTTLSISASTGNVIYDTILVRMMPTSVGNFAGWLTISVAGLTDSVYLTGTVPDCHNAIPYTYSFTNSDWNECWTIVNANGDGAAFHMNVNSGYCYYSYSYSNTADDWLISPYFHFNGHQYGSMEYRTASTTRPERFEVYALGADTILLTSLMEVNNTYYQTLLWDNLSTLNGNYRIGIHCVTPSNATYFYVRNFNIFNFPNLMLDNDSINFPITNMGSSSAAQQVVLQQAGVTAPITVTAPTHFEVSADGVNFGTQCTIPADTAFAAVDTFYVRFSPLQKDSITGQLIVSVADVADTMWLTGFARDCNDTVQLPFRESFEGPFTYCWTILDQDGDGVTWEQRNSSYYAHSGGYSVYSASHYDSYLGDHIPQDNWLISQPVYISDTAFLSYYAKSSSWSSLTHSVYVSTTGTNLSDFTELTTDTTRDGYYISQRIFSLADYVGQTIHIAFRILAESDCYLDDVTIATKESQPLLLVTPSYIDYKHISSGYGEVRSFTVEPMGNVGNIVISGNTICDFSTDGITFSNPLTIPSTGGTVYARITPASQGYINETVNISSEHADLQVVTLHAQAFDCYNTIPYSYSFNNYNRNNCWTVENYNNDSNIFQFLTNQECAYLRVYSSYDMDEGLISPLFQFDGNQYGFFDYWGQNSNLRFGNIQVFAMGATDTIPISPVVKVPKADHQRLIFNTSSLQGTYHIGIRVTADPISNIEYLYISNFNIQNISPVFNVSPDTLDFGTEFLEETHANQLVLVTTVDISNPITITAPAPFEVSVDGGVTYSTSLTIPANNTAFVYDSVLVRMSPTIPGDFAGWMILSTAGFVDSVYLTGNVPDCHNTIPYSYSFSDSQWNECWSIVNANRDGWAFYMSTSNEYAYFYVPSGRTVNEWLISPYFQLTGSHYGFFDYMGAFNHSIDSFQVFAIGETDTIPLGSAVPENNNEYHRFYFDLSSLQGTYRVGVHIEEDTTSVYQYLYIKNFNILPLVPEITANPDTLNLGTEILEDYHQSLPVEVMTLGNTNPVTITVPAPFEVSADGGVTYGTSMTIPANSAFVVYDTVLVRMAPTTSGDFTGWMTLSFPGATDSVYLSGRVPDCHNTIPYSYSFTDSQWNECWTIINANNDSKKFNLNISYGYAYYLYNTSLPADDWLISPYFLFDGMQYGSIDCRKSSSGYSERFEVYALGADTILIMPVMEVNSSSYETVMLDFTQLNGTYRIGFHCVSPANQYYLYLKNFNVLPLVPDISTNPATLDFGKQTINTTTAAQEVTVDLEGIFNAIPITVPAPFEVSLDGNTFSGSVTLPAKSTAFAVDTFYVRFNPTVPGVFNPMLIVSAGTVADTILLYGEAYNCAVAQSLPIVEGFETTLSPCWTTLDADGDGQNWMSTASFTSTSYAGHDSPLAYVSRSWNSTALNPDDWLVSPQIAPTDNTVLSFFVKGSYATEHFAVYVSTDNTLSSFLATTPIITGISTNEWKQYAARLSDYVGDSVYVAFRHYDSYDLYHLLLDDVVITDSLEHPILMVNPDELTFGTVGTGEVATDSIVVDGYGFTSTMVAGVADPFTISLDGSSFTNILAIPPYGGTLYVRYAPTTEGTHNGTITIMPAGMDNVTIPLHGTGLDCQNTVPYSYQFNDNRTLCWTVENANQDNRTFQFNTADSCVYYYYSTQNAADDWLISPQFTFNGNMYGYFDYRTSSSLYPERYEVFALGTDTIRLTQPMEVTNISIERQLLDFTSLIGPYRIGIHCISDADMYNFYIKNFNIQNITPTFMTNVDSLDFGMQALGTQSDPQQVILTSIGVYTPITVTAPAQYEVSLDGVNYSSSLILPYHITAIVNDTLFVRLAPTAVGLFNSPLTISSNNLQKTIMLTGMSRDCDAAATVPFMEDFEGYNNYCWTIVDGDNDGYEWWKDNNSTNAHSGTGHMVSESYHSSTPLCPDNWLISQPIQLPEIPARLSFWVSSSSSYYADEHYSVYVSTSGNSIQDFTNAVFTSVSVYGYQQQSVSLRDYAGQTVYIAFRHHNTCNELKLLLDDISIQLDTVPQLPLVATDSVMAITQLSAAGVGHLVFDGNDAITDRGFCWSTSPNPTLSDSHVSSPTPSASFMGMLTGLSEHTTYHLRAYATNSFGTVYGEDVVFTTLCGPATYTSFNQTACESYTWNGTTYETSGDYVQTLENVIGCDSIVTMHLTIYHGDSTEFTQEACESFTWANTNYSTSGDYTKTFANVHGCDSVVTMHLTIYHGDVTAFSDTACEAYTWDNTVYTTSGDYTKTFANVHGCDSVVTLHLTIHYGDSTEFEQTTCDSYVWEDSTYTVSGDYTRLYENVNGCDSVVTMHLTVYPSVTSEFVESCPDSCYIWNGESFCASGDYTQTLQTIHGCDSVVTLHLTITVGVENPVIDQNLQVYPNPTNGLLSIRGTAFTQVLLFDAYGKRIGVWNVEGDVTQIDLSSYAPGVYFVKVMDKQQIVGVKKVIKQ